jgi:nucleotide-binding universal stress UspA family protein
MKKMKKILVPTDFSSASYNALDYVTALLGKENIEVTLLHAFYTPPASPEAMGGADFLHTEEIRKVHLERLQKKVAELKQEGINCKEELTYGTVADRCREAAETHKVNMIAMGTTGASGFQKYIIGSNATDVIDISTVPVLAVPHDYKYKPLNKILFATDFADSDIASLLELTVLAAANNTEIIVYHVSKEDPYETPMFEWFEEMVKEKIKYPNISYRINKNGDVLNGLNDFIKDFEIDLLSMSKRDLNFFEKIFSKSITKEMAFRATVPMLVFRAENSGDMLNIF